MTLPQNKEFYLNYRHMEKNITYLFQQCLVGAFTSMPGTQHMFISTVRKLLFGVK